MDNQIIYRIDIDNTLFDTVETDYKSAKPISDRIKKVNKLFEEGNIILIETGRHWKYYKLTKKQLEKSGLKYHSLLLGKPPGIIIDDMAINAADFFK